MTIKEIFGFEEYIIEENDKKVKYSFPNGYSVLVKPFWNEWLATIFLGDEVFHGLYGGEVTDDSSYIKEILQTIFDLQPQCQESPDALARG